MASGDGVWASSPFDEWLADDPEVAELLRAEIDRQSTTLQLIASENFTSPAVLAASGSVLTNKYSEGYPGRRYYGGNQVIDEVENLARDRATALFGAEHANVQPHAGANANLAVYQALLEPGDTVLAMRLDQGGHLTHGSPASITSKIWRFVAYGVTPASADPDGAGRGHRLRRGGRRRQAGAAQADRGGRHRLPAPHRRPSPSGRSPTRWGPGSCSTSPIPPGWWPGVPTRTPWASPTWSRSPPTRPCAARAVAPSCADQDLAKAIDSAVFPGLQGGPLEHVIAAKAVAFREAATPSFRAYAANVVANARALADAPGGRGLPAGVGRHRQPPAPRRPAPLRRRAHRQGGPGGPRPGRDHAQPQHHPRRPPLALRDLGAPAGHGRADHGGHGRRRDGRASPRSWAAALRATGDDADRRLRDVFDGARSLAAVRRGLPAVSRRLDPGSAGAVGSCTARIGGS